MIRWRSERLYVALQCAKGRRGVCVLRETGSNGDWSLWRLGADLARGLEIRWVCIWKQRESPRAPLCNQQGKPHDTESWSLIKPENSMVLKLPLLFPSLSPTNCSSHGPLRKFYPPRQPLLLWCFSTMPSSLSHVHTRLSHLSPLCLPHNSCYTWSWVCLTWTLVLSAQLD